MGAGQFCTNPGMTVLVDDAAGRAFAAQLGEELAKIAPGTAVACPIASAYEKGLAAKIAAGEVELIAKSKLAPVRAESAMIPALIATSAANYLAKPELAHEVFGPVSQIVWVKSAAEMVSFARQLEGQLTASIHGEAAELTQSGELIAVLEEKAGRVIVNQFPTGVEVCHAIFHGGPFPASTAPATTSVGSGAIERFSRPVCYQNLPQSLLPAELRDDNPLGLMRLVNGQRTR
jgi:NADP-dependent aldehyde dehydrogenase